MKIGIVVNNQPHSKDIAARLKRLLAKNQIPIDDLNPDIVISIGGDGTLLYAFHRYVHQLDKVHFIGIHTGHLGFYTDWRDYELDELVDSLCHHNGKSVSYPLLDVQVRFEEEEKNQHFLALNESTIKSFDKTLVADVWIKDDLFERFRGDGLSIATPTGSTAYNKSVGGAVIHPRVSALQLTEVASINNRVYRTLGSPLVIAQDEWISIKFDEPGTYMLTIDHISRHLMNVKELKYRIANERIHFVSFRHTHFWRRVKDAFISDGSNGSDQGA